MPPQTSALLRHQIDGPLLLVSSTTHSWTLQVPDGRNVTFSCKGKVEHRLDGREFYSASIFDSHPALDHYLVPWTTIYVSSPAEHPKALLLSLDRVIQTASLNLRTANEYINAYNPAHILSQGRGAIFVGPNSYAIEVQQVLSEASIQHTAILSEASTVRTREQALLQLEDWFVVAEKFSLDP